MTEPDERLFMKTTNGRFYEVICFVPSDNKTRPKVKLAGGQAMYVFDRHEIKDQRWSLYTKTELTALRLKGEVKLENIYHNTQSEE